MQNKNSYFPTFNIIIINAYIIKIKLKKNLMVNFFQNKKGSFTSIIPLQGQEIAKKKQLMILRWHFDRRSIQSYKCFPNQNALYLNSFSNAVAGGMLSFFFLPYSISRTRLCSFQFLFQGFSVKKKTAFYISFLITKLFLSMNSSGIFQIRHYHNSI